MKRLEFFSVLTIILVVPLVQGAVIFEDTFTTSDGNLYDYDSWNNGNDTEFIKISGNKVNISNPSSDVHTYHNITGTSGKSSFDVILNITPNNQDAGERFLIASFGDSVNYAYDNNDIWLGCSNQNFVTYDWGGGTVLETGACNSSATSGQVLIEAYSCSGDYCLYNLSWRGVSKLTGRQYWNYPLINVRMTAWEQSGTLNSPAYADNLCIADDYTECFAATDTCTSFLTDGALDCSDNCSFTSNVTLTTETTITGSGTMTISNNAWWNVADTVDYIRLLLADSCIIKISDGSGIKYDY